MIVKLDKIGKRYHSWVIRDCSLIFQGPAKMGIAGPNGSGKSTLLKIVAGYLSPSSGSITWSLAGKSLDHDSLAPQVNFYGPYSRGIEELTLEEHLNYHCTFKLLRNEWDNNDFFAWTNLEAQRQKILKTLSSGLYQRFMLGLTIASTGQLFLFDEPCSFLDAKTRNWFFESVDNLLSDRLVVIASNQDGVLDFCSSTVTVEDHKGGS